MSILSLLDSKQSCEVYQMWPPVHTWGNWGSERWILLRSNRFKMICLCLESKTFLPLSHFSETDSFQVLGSWCPKNQKTQYPGKKFLINSHGPASPCKGPTLGEDSSHRKAGRTPWISTHWTEVPELEALCLYLIDIQAKCSIFPV